MALTYRSEKGSALTFDELDNNFRALTGSQTISGNLIVTEGARITGSVSISGSNTFTNIGPFIQTGELSVTGSISSDTLINSPVLQVGLDSLGANPTLVPGITSGIRADSLTLDVNIATSAATDDSHYSINGKRGEIRSQLQKELAAHTGSFRIELRNSSVATNSLIVANVLGGPLSTGSLVTANVISLATASLNFINSGNIIITDNSPFTASFAIF